MSETDVKISISLLQVRADRIAKRLVEGRDASDLIKIGDAFQKHLTRLIDFINGRTGDVSLEVPQEFETAEERLRFLNGIISSAKSCL